MEQKEQMDKNAMEKVKGVFTVVGEAGEKLQSKAEEDFLNSLDEVPKSQRIAQEEAARTAHILTVIMLIVGFIGILGLFGNGSATNLVVMGAIILEIVLGLFALEYKNKSKDDGWKQIGNTTTHNINIGTSDFNDSSWEDYYYDPSLSHLGGNIYHQQYINDRDEKN